MVGVAPQTKRCAGPRWIPRANRPRDPGFVGASIPFLSGLCCGKTHRGWVRGRISGTVNRHSCERPIPRGQAGDAQIWAFHTHFRALRPARGRAVAPGRGVESGQSAAIYVYVGLSYSIDSPLPQFDERREAVYRTGWIKHALEIQHQSCGRNITKDIQN